MNKIVVLILITQLLIATNLYASRSNETLRVDVLQTKLERLAREGKGLLVALFLTERLPSDPYEVDLEFSHSQSNPFTLPIAMVENFPMKRLKRTLLPGGHYSLFFKEIPLGAGLYHFSVHSQMTHRYPNTIVDPGRVTILTHLVSRDAQDPDEDFLFLYRQILLSKLSKYEDFMDRIQTSLDDNHPLRFIVNIELDPNSYGADQFSRVRLDKAKLFWTRPNNELADEAVEGQGIQYQGSYEIPHPYKSKRISKYQLHLTMDSPKGMHPQQEVCAQLYLEGILLRQGVSGQKSYPLSHGGTLKAPSEFCLENGKRDIKEFYVQASQVRPGYWKIIKQ